MGDPRRRPLLAEQSDDPATALVAGIVADEMGAATSHIEAQCAMLAVAAATTLVAPMLAVEKQEVAAPPEAVLEPVLERDDGGLENDEWPGPSARRRRYVGLGASGRLIALRQRWIDGAIDAETARRAFDAVTVLVQAGLMPSRRLVFEAWVDDSSDDAPFAYLLGYRDPHAGSWPDSCVADPCNVPVRYRAS